MSSSTTKNELTDREEVVVRDFYEQIVQNERLFNTNTKTRNVIGAACLNLLGYTVSGGMIVPIGEQITFKYGERPSDSKWANLYYNDGALVRAAANDNDSD